MPRTTARGNSPPARRDAMKALIDGLKSLLSALATVVVCGGPVWLSHLAIQEGLAPLWAYAPVVLLAGLGLLMTFAFLRKALNGISPSRDRRR